MSDGGKGSAPRPFSVSQETYGDNFDAIFRKKKPVEDNTGISKNEYYDIMTTEEALRSNAETQEALNHNKTTPR